MSENLFELNVMRHSGQLMSELLQSGYDVLAPADYGEIAALVAATGRGHQTPMLTLERNDFTRNEAFWLFLMREGQPVAGTAARRIDLAGESIEAYLRRTSRAQYGRDSDPIAAIAPTVSAKLTGQLIYLGELELHPGHRGRARLLYRFARVMMGMAALKWPGFDVMFAFVPKEHIKLADGYGFSWKTPRAITWADPVPKWRRDDHWMVATARADFEHLWSGPEPFDF